MPVEQKCPWGAEWIALTPNGQEQHRVLQPEDLLADMARGCTVAELSAIHDAPISAVSHCVMLIKYMMVWRGKPQEYLGEGEGGHGYIKSFGPVINEGEDETL